jgi:motility quorum-sensing regulator/GCU-specific mRNA interferase toxin
LRPTYNLEAIKKSIGNVDRLAITTTALKGAVSLGFDRSGIVDVIHSTTSRMFYKSMTTNFDHRVWQDVYHVPYEDWLIYLKFQADAVTEFRVMSFKEKQ